MKPRRHRVALSPALAPMLGGVTGSRGRRAGAGVLLSRSRLPLCYAAFVEPHPFRQPAERPTAPPDEPRLGKLRAVYAVHRRYALCHAGRGALLLMFTGIFGAFIAGWQGFLRSLPLGLAGSSVLAAWALRRRGLRIALHDHGIVVDRRQGP